MSTALAAEPSTQTAVDPRTYNRVIVALSGKDSIAAFLHLLEIGVDPSTIELHHHLVDGEGEDFMDWPCHHAYVDKFANAFGVPITYSWREGGFKRELERDNTPTAPSIVPINGQMQKVGGNGPENTRGKFPQVSANLGVRWCSPALKLGPFAAWLQNDPSFREGRTLVITGERAEESRNRATYAQFEPHRCDLRNGQSYQRYIDHWRPVLLWPEAMVWDIMKRWRIVPPIGYRIGLGRMSCLFCIFHGKEEWALVRAVHPKGFIRIAKAEERSGLTIHREHSIVELADMGRPPSIDPELMRIALSKTYDGPIFEPGEWTLPPGAFKRTGGPS